MIRSLETLYLAFACIGSLFPLPAMALRSTVEAAQAVGLLPRADVCGGNQGLSQCGGSFPSSFCCQTGDTCFGFNNNQGAICCPTTDCSATNPLSCEIQVYNATTNPASPMHLANLTDVKLQPCASGCCPPGFSCSNSDGQDQCILSKLLASITTAASTAAPTSIPSPTVVSGITAASTLTSIPTAHSSTTPPSSLPAAASSSSSSSNQFPLQAVLVGLFPGLVGGCLIALVIIFCLARRRQPPPNVEDDTSSFGNVTAKVSDPIYLGSAARTDFLRAKHSSRSTGGSSPSSRLSRVRSLFSKTPTLSPRRFGDHGSVSPYTQAASPGRAGEVSEVHTPQRQIKHEPSMESIKIYSPPDARFGRNTQFGDLLSAADAGRHEAPSTTYMGSPSIVDPRKRGVDNGNLR